VGIRRGGAGRPAFRAATAGSLEGPAACSPVSPASPRPAAINPPVASKSEPIWAAYSSERKNSRRLP
jgi:hypothetical protein